MVDCDDSFFESETLRRAGLYPALRNAARADLRRSLSSIPAPASLTSVNCESELGVLNSLYLILCQTTQVAKGWRNLDNIFPATTMALGVDTLLLVSNFKKLGNGIFLSVSMAAESQLTQVNPGLTITCTGVM